jgi:hypothetical protein
MEELKKYLEELAQTISSNNSKAKDDVLISQGQFEAVQLIYNKVGELEVEKPKAKKKSKTKA